MANDNDATQTAGPTAEQEIDRFQGFSTKDGEVQKDAPAAPRPNGVPNTGRFTPKAPAEKKEPAAADGDTDPDDDGKHASADKRIGQAVGRQRAAERRADKAESDLRSMSERMARLEGAAAAGGLTNNGNKDTAPKAPVPKDYEGGEYDARYLADVAKFEARAAVAEATKTVRTETQSAAQTAQQTQRTAEFQRQRDEFFTTASETYDDFEDVVGDASNPLSQTVGELAMDSDFGAQILYELASEPKEARKVASMTPAKQAAWFGRQEARLTPDDTGAGEDDGGEEKPLPGPKPKVSKAPPVPDFNGRGSGQVPKVSGSTTDFAAFERANAVGAKK